MVSTNEGTIVLSTGRCGGTMLSRMINDNESVLSLNEFFFALGWAAINNPRLSGARYWKALRDAPNFMGIYRDPESYVHIPSEVINRPDDGGWPHADCPSIALMTLPHLSDDPRSLLAELDEVVETWPKRTVMEHNHALFDHLRKRYGKRTWVERSGNAAILLTPEIGRGFPDAKFIHMIRDGRDVALSMHNHMFFNIFNEYFNIVRRMGFDMYQTEPRRRPLLRVAAAVLARLTTYKMSARNRRDALLEKASTPTIENLRDLGRNWSDCVLAADRFLSRVPKDRVHVLHYEDLLTDPRRHLREVINFVDPNGDHSGWIDRMAAIPRRPKSRWTDIPKDWQEAVNEICAPGLALAGYDLKRPASVTALDVA